MEHTRLNPLPPEPDATPHAPLADGWDAATRWLLPLLHAQGAEYDEAAEEFADDLAEYATVDDPAGAMPAFHRQAEGAPELGALASALRDEYTRWEAAFTEAVREVATNKDVTVKGAVREEPAGERLAFSFAAAERPRSRAMTFRLAYSDTALALALSDAAPRRAFAVTVSDGPNAELTATAELVPDREGGMRLRVRLASAYAALPAMVALRSEPANGSDSAQADSGWKSLAGDGYDFTFDPAAAGSYWLALKWLAADGQWHEAEGVLPVEAGS